MNNRQLYFNGIRAGTGEYLMPPMSLSSFAKKTRQLGIDNIEGKRGLPAGVDPTDLASTGWAVVFAESTPAAVREALQPLLDLRRSQASLRDDRLYRELGFPRSQTAREFLDSHLVGPGPVRPCAMPYYQLLVGSPEEIPFTEQEQLDLQLAVGRLHFDTVEEYACYARSVVRAEQEATVCAKKAVLFAPQSNDDEATRLTVDDLVLPLSRDIGPTDGYQLETVTGGEATKSRLCDLLAGPQPPAFLLTAGHGICYYPDDSRQRDRQGGLVCADWPGPKAWHNALPDRFVLFAEDLPSSSLLGLITFHFACYSGGTPVRDSYTGQEIAERPFMARLPQRLLANPSGGALAVVAHVDKAFEHSFLWDKAGSQTEVFRTVLWHLLNGVPVGHAMDCFGQRYAEIAAWLYNQRFEPHDDPNRAEQLEAMLWTAYWDARRYCIVGDPAVRLAERS